MAALRATRLLPATQAKPSLPVPTLHSTKCVRRQLPFATRVSKKAEVQEALGALKQAVRQPTVDPAYVNGAAYLRTLGILNQAEVARVLDISMNPNSLFLSEGRRTRNSNARKLDVEEDMKPVVEFLISKGVPIGDIPKIIVAHPPVLSYSVEQRLAPFFDYLASVGVSDPVAVVLQRPSLLGLDVDANLRKMVDYLRYVETPPETIVKYLVESL